MERFQKLAREVLGESIQILKDPRVGFVTVTEVRITHDLRHAKVYVSIFGSEEERALSLEGLESAKTHLRGVLGRQMRTKYLPDLHFHLDTLPEEAEHLERIFNKIHEEQAAGSGIDQDPEAEGSDGDAG
ncbi:MAG: 30S ribosome-binding factor RbfA [Actinobacteria bacterium]|nr:30S ribosome-binding factor RbfA [Actinomycetota bacterium]